jgi:hypothetical protein
MSGDDEDTTADEENPKPRRDGGPRPSNVTAKDRDAHPDRAADRQHPGSDVAAGPHAQPSLTNEEATPGAGTLPDSGARKGDEDMNAGTG